MAGLAVSALGISAIPKDNIFRSTACSAKGQKIVAQFALAMYLAGLVPEQSKFRSLIRSAHEDAWMASSCQSGSSLSRIWLIRVPRPGGGAASSVSLAAGVFVLCCGRRYLRPGDRLP